MISTSASQNASLHGQRKLYVLLDMDNLSSTNTLALSAARRMLSAAVERAIGRRIEVEVNAQIIGASFVGIVVEASARARANNSDLRVCGLLLKCSSGQFTTFEGLKPASH